MARSKQGKAKGVRQKGGRGRGSVAKYVASSSRHGFDGSVSPPRRQTASVLRQPVTIFSTSSEETKPAPPTEIRRAFGRLTKPFQLFCFKRLQGYRAMTFRDPEDPTSACPELVSPPNKIFPVGPGVDEEVACLSLCSSLQNFSKGLPVTGQTGPKKALESNPNVNFNPDQPLIQAVMISEEDIMMQERRVLDARRRLEEALKHFG